MSSSLAGTATDLVDGSHAQYEALFTMSLTRASEDTVPDLLAAIAVARRR